jgi:hypothetical protein
MLVGPFNLLIPAGVKQNSSDVFNILDPDSGGSATFGVQLSESGAAPATYFGARTMLEEATIDALRTMTTTQFKAYVDQLSVVRGRNPVGSITAFKGAIVIDENPDFWAFVTARGLKPVIVPM